jgi:hypothetical protein
MDSRCFSNRMHASVSASVASDGRSTSDTLCRQFARSNACLGLSYPRARTTSGS